jgi:hypothetical protein
MCTSVQSLPRPRLTAAQEAQGVVLVQGGEWL